MVLAVRRESVAQGIEDMASLDMTYSGCRTFFLILYPSKGRTLGYGDQSGQYRYAHLERFAFSPMLHTARRENLAGFEEHRVRFTGNTTIDEWHSDHASAGSEAMNNTMKDEIFKEIERDLTMSDGMHYSETLASNVPDLRSSAAAARGPAAAAGK